MIRKVSIVFFGLLITLCSQAQYGHMPNRVNTYTDGSDEGNGFLKQNLFLGGSLGLGFGGDQFDIGVNPEVGYSLTKWLDAGVVVNFNYSSITPDPSGYYNPDVSDKQFTYGAGVFGRAWFLPFLFVTAQPEYNWTSDRQSDQGSPYYTTNISAASLLVGAGYGRRMRGEGTFYIAIMVDVLGSRNSPYNDPFTGSPLPVLRAGFDIFVHKR